MSHSVRRHMRVAVDAYDDSIRTFIPGYEEMLSEVACLVAAASPEHVLDLGAGTGALTQALLRQCPNCSVELIDVDAEMLEQARERLAPFATRVQFNRRPFQGALPTCDAVVASLALHHVPTLAEKRRVFGAVHAALNAGGVFVNGDACMSADADIRRGAYRTWAAHLVSCGIAQAQAWRHFEDWADEDTYLPLEDELAALTAVGFEAECVWRSTPIAVVKSVKPSRKPS